jgi:hypothetical protein
MAAKSSWRHLLQAAESAGRLLDELEVDQTRQVDVFTMCEDLDLWLAFLPMDGLLGAFVPEGTGGVLITDRRPIPVQRYTAAHELGHWRLEHGHGLALDGQEHVFGDSATERERLAQMFAASLLMPPALILSLTARIGLNREDQARPDQVYFVAREAGVSYEAAVRQLVNLQVITTAESAQLLGIRPITIKSQLADGRRPVYGYADVWPVDERWNDQLLSLRADDEIVISLPENRSTGYRWTFEDEVIEVIPIPEPPNLPPPKLAVERLVSCDESFQLVGGATSSKVPGAALERARRANIADVSHPESHLTLHGDVEVVGDSYIPGRGAAMRPVDASRARLARISRKASAPSASAVSAEDPRAMDRPDSSPHGVVIAATGRRVLGVRFAEPGPKTLRLQYRTLYVSEPPVEEYVLHAIVEPRRWRFSIDQLIDEPSEPWVAEVRERKIREATMHVDDVESA